MAVTIDEITVADPPEAWTAAGFTVDADDVCRVGTVRIRLIGRDGGKRIVGWSLRGAPAGALDDGSLDGLPTTASTAEPCDPAVHEIGATYIDHLVLLSPDLHRTVKAFESIGLDVRGERDTDTYGAPMRQVFFRAGEVILELIGSPEAPGEGDPGFFGLAYTVSDLDGLATRLGEGLGAIKDAVQDGRRIATLRHKTFGMSVATALMTPEPAPA